MQVLQKNRGSEKMRKTMRSAGGKPVINPQRRFPESGFLQVLLSCGLAVTLSSHQPQGSHSKPGHLVSPWLSALKLA